jgi:hypothetical protein
MCFQQNWTQLPHLHGCFNCAVIDFSGAKVGQLRGKRLNKKSAVKRVDFQPVLA